jgi:hypothetical protein
MPRTQLNLGEQGANGTVVRGDLNTATSGSALITKVIVGNAVTTSIAYTGADSGTGDVTVTVAGIYDIAQFVEGVWAAAETVLSLNVRRSFSLPAGLTGSYVDAKTAATASTTITFTHNGTSIGTAVFAASGTVATLTFASAVTFAVGDTFEIVGPSTADTTLAGTRFYLMGTRLS